MATYDLEQQEQLDQFKHFWKQYGNLITWVLVLVLGAYAAWTGYQHWQQKRAEGASSLYEELDRAVIAGDDSRAAKVFTDMREGFAGTTFTEQGAMLLARLQVAKQQPEAARASLKWLVDNGKNKDLVSIARLRLSGLLLDAKQFDEALKTLSSDISPAYAAMAADRRGDILMAQGKKAEAVKAYQEAWTGMPATVEYRRFIDGKLTAAGLAPTPVKSPAH